MGDMETSSISGMPTGMWGIRGYGKTGIWGNRGCGDINWVWEYGDSYRNIGIWRYVDMGISADMGIWGYGNGQIWGYVDMGIRS